MSLRRARLEQRANPRNYGPVPEGQLIKLPSPTMGMNTRDGVSTLDPREARSVRNMISERGKTTIREGQTSHQTISGASSVGSMFTHEGVSADVMLAAANNEIYNVTGTPSALTSNSYSLDTWAMVQFNDTTIGVNGTDTPWAFDGSTVGASGLSGSGLTITNLRTVHVVGVRMWFTEVNQARVWYLAPNAVTGTLTQFDLGQETKGGYCVGVYEYGPYTIFIMSSGEIVTYQGDPGTDFSQAKTYNAPRPVGYDPAINVNGEPVIMTASGPLPFETIARGLDDDAVDQGPWGKIAPSWAQDFDNYGSNANWNAVFFKGLVILNIQVDSTTSKQWVFTTRTKSWSFFDGLDGFQFTEYNGDIYFSDKATNTIWKYAGGTDDGTAITATIRGGFTYPFQSHGNGQYTVARVNVASTGFATAQIQVDTDYEENGVSSAAFQISSSGSGPWGEPWGSPWGTAGQPILKWSSISGFGQSVAYVCQFNSQADDLEFFGVDIIAAPCGITG